VDSFSGYCFSIALPTGEDLHVAMTHELLETVVAMRPLLIAIRTVLMNLDSLTDKKQLVHAINYCSTIPTLSLDVLCPLVDLSHGLELNTISMVRLIITAFLE